MVSRSTRRRIATARQIALPAPDTAMDRKMRQFEQQLEWYNMARVEVTLKQPICPNRNMGLYGTAAYYVGRKHETEARRVRAQLLLEERRNKRRTA